jgi:hypothetical protein
VRLEFESGSASPKLRLVDSYTVFADAKLGLSKNSVDGGAEFKIAFDHSISLPSHLPVRLLIDDPKAAAGLLILQASTSHSSSTRLTLSGDSILHSLPLLESQRSLLRSLNGSITLNYPKDIRADFISALGVASNKHGFDFDKFVQNLPKIASLTASGESCSKRGLDFDTDVSGYKLALALGLQKCNTAEGVMPFHY